MKARSVNEVARDSNTSRSTVYLAIKSKALVAKKLGRRTIILDDAFESWLKNLPEAA
jgi:excisionase family DNA binding protein